MNLTEPEFISEFAGFSVYMSNFEDGGVNSELKKVIDFIRTNSGKRTNIIAGTLGISIDTLEKQIRKLKKEGIIEFRGAPKNGGYYIKKEISNSD